jgi:gas vesicle protein
LFSAGIALGAILGASVALLWAPASGGETRERIARRVRGDRDDDDNIWDELARELELAATESEEDEEQEEILAALKT